MNSNIIDEINSDIDTLNKYGVNLPKFNQIYKGKDKNVIDFLLMQYKIAIHKSYNTINYNKTTKLINKNPKLNERFTFKKDADLLKLMQSKEKKERALMYNFINAFTKVLQEKNLQFAFTTQTILPKYRNKQDIDIEKNILMQKEVLNSFHRCEHKYYQFFKKRTKTTSTTTIKSATREFIRAIEFHKNLNLHEHTIKAFDDSFSHLVKYIELYDKNRIAHKEIGRCEIVVDAKYKTQLIKHFKLKRYTNTKTEFYYNNYKFSGSIKNGDQLCIKFFDNTKVTSTATQIAKYLISYLGDTSKQNHKFIFNNLKIKNITHSQVLFSKHLYAKIYAKFSKHKKLEKYKDMYLFSRAYDRNDIIIEHKYDNTLYTDQKYETLIDLNDRFNDKMNEYKLSGDLKSFNKLKSHYNRFIARHIEMFKNMHHFLTLEFVKENITMDVDISKYTLTSAKIHKAIKTIDNDIEKLASNSYVKSDTNYEKIYDQDISLLDTTAIIKQDILLENIEAKLQEDAGNKTALIQNIEESFTNYADINNKLFSFGFSRLQYSMMAFEDRTKEFIEQQYYLKEFKDFESKYYKDSIL